MEGCRGSDVYALILSLQGLKWKPFFFSLESKYKKEKSNGIAIKKKI